MQAIDEEKESQKRNDALYVKQVLDRLKNQFDTFDERGPDLGDGSEQKLTGNSLQRIA